MGNGFVWTIGFAFCAFEAGFYDAFWGWNDKKVGGKLCDWNGSFKSWKRFQMQISIDFMENEVRERASNCFKGFREFP